MAGSPLSKGSHALLGHLGGIPTVAPAAHREIARAVLEVVLSFAAGVAAFVVTAVVGSVAGPHVPEALFGLLLVAGVAVVARLAGILFALPVGVAAVLAFDWYVLPPLRILDDDTLVLLGTFLLASVSIAEATTRALRRAVDAERARGALAAEQAALRRVATLVARQAAPEEVFHAVAEETGHLLGVDVAQLFAVENSHWVREVGIWRRNMPLSPSGTRLPLDGNDVVVRVFDTGRPARTDDHSGVEGPTADYARSLGLGAAVAAPVVVEGRMWGVMTAALLHPAPVGPGAEARVAAFAELVGTAIANADARTELGRLVDGQAALRRVATLVARGVPPAEVFAAVTAETGQLLGADFTLLNRYDPPDGAVIVGAWTAAGGGVPLRIGRRWPLGGRNTATMVFQTGRPARIDAEGGEVDGILAELVRHDAARSLVAAPISIDGRLWGVMSVVSGSPEPLPMDTEERLAGFTELVATALANAEAREAVAASRVRIVAAADASRRRLERDLHDGAQQRLVSLALYLRTLVREAPETDGLVTKLDGVAAALGEVLDELREIARGLHPAALADGGLPTALKTLARRSAVPVRLDVRVEGRLADPIELAAYFFVAEALTNAAKHAQATVVDVQVATVDGRLGVCVRDDGRGGARLSGGTGLVGLADRVEALGGSLALDSAPGEGTAVEIDLPLSVPNLVTSSVEELVGQ